MMSEVHKLAKEKNKVAGESNENLEVTLVTTLVTLLISIDTVKSVKGEVLKNGQSMK